MTVGNINIKQTIERIQAEIAKDRSISLVLISSIELLIIVIQMLLDRFNTNSSNSSIPPSTDKKRRGRDKKKRKKRGAKNIGGQAGHDGSTLEQYKDPDEVIELSIDLQKREAILRLINYAQFLIRK